MKELQNEGNEEHLFEYMKQCHRNLLWLSLLADQNCNKNDAEWSIILFEGK